MIRCYDAGDLANSDTTLPKLDEDGQRASSPMHMADTDCSIISTLSQPLPSPACRLFERSRSIDASRSVGVSEPSSFSRRCSITRMASFQSPRAVSVVLNTPGDGSESLDQNSVHLSIQVNEEMGPRNRLVKSPRNMGAAAPDSMLDRGKFGLAPAALCEITPIAEVTSSAERQTQHSEQSIRQTDSHVQQEDMWESIGSTTVPSVGGFDCFDIHGEPSKRSFLLKEESRAGIKGIPVPPGTFASPRHSADAGVSGNAAADSTGSESENRRRADSHASRSAAPQVRSRTRQGGDVKARTKGTAPGGSHSRAHSGHTPGERNSPATDARWYDGPAHASIANALDAELNTDVQGYDRGLPNMPIARAPEEGLRTAIAEMEVEEALLQLHEVVGRGAFGCVYRGTWRGLNVRCNLLLNDCGTVVNCVQQPPPSVL